MGSIRIRRRTLIQAGGTLAGAAVLGLPVRRAFADEIGRAHV